MSAYVLVPGRVLWVPALRADDDNIPTIAEEQERYGARLAALRTRRRQQEQMTTVVARAETAREPAPSERQQQPIHSRRDIHEEPRPGPTTGEPDGDTLIRTHVSTPGVGVQSSERYRPGAGAASTGGRASRDRR